MCPPQAKSESGFVYRHIAAVCGSVGMRSPADFVVVVRCGAPAVPKISSAASPTSVPGPRARALLILADINGKGVVGTDGASHTLVVREGSLAVVPFHDVSPHQLCFTFRASLA